MLNIVVPMAGRGSRFQKAGYSLPKPLINLGGRPMISWVIENIRPDCEHRFIFICQKEHLEQYPFLQSTLNNEAPGCVIIPIEGVTDGAACTVMLARDYIENGDPLMIANSDQFVDCDINDYLAQIEEDDVDGLIMTFWADNPKWSYCGMNSDGTVSEVVEKEVISNEATVGIYNFKYGADFVRAATQMIEKKVLVKGEYYVAPVYNELIKQGAKVITYSVGEDQNGMYGLGVPEDLEFFITTEHFKAAEIHSSCESG